jgi:hypothetical protein
MNRLSRRAVGLSIVTALGCAPAAPAGIAARCPEAATSTPSPGAAPKSDDATPRLAFTITPDPRTGNVDVEVVAQGDPALLTRWSIREPFGTFTLTSLRDDAGSLASTGSVEKGAITLARPPRGAVHLAYAVHVKPGLPNQVLPVNLDPNHFEGAGEALLALPDALDDQLTAATIHVRGPYWEEGSGASSFGFGEDREVSARGRDLRFATFLFGSKKLGRALFDTSEGHDEAVWLGYTSFDPRPISADVAAFRTAVRELFHEAEGGPLTLLIVADGRTPGAFRATRRASSILAHVGAGEPWSAPVRIAVATEVIHGWLGSRLWIGPSDAAHEAESFWFSEGVARGLARDLLFRFGLITTSELLDEMHGLAGVLATSPRRKESNAELAAHGKDAGSIPLVIARGALYAARVDALIRAKSKGKRSLQEVLRGLYDSAKERRAPLPTSAWVEAITAELDAGEKDVFHRVIEEGARPDLPEGLLGPCFQGAPRTYAAFDLGFDEAATRAGATPTIVGLRAGGPAERAGVRADDVLLDLAMSQGRAESKVTLSLERGGEKRSLSYLPTGPTAAWRGWVRKRDVAEEACTK